MKRATRGHTKKHRYRYTHNRLIPGRSTSARNRVFESPHLSSRNDNNTISCWQYVKRPVHPGGPIFFLIFYSQLLSQNVPYIVSGKKSKRDFVQHRYSYGVELVGGSIVVRLIRHGVGRPTDGQQCPCRPTDVSTLLSGYYDIARI